MTSRELRVDRSDVFDRDDHTCQHCERTGEPEALRLIPVGDAPTDGAVHVRSVATVCRSCADVLRGDAAADGETTAAASDVTTDELFELVRETTRRQGETVSDVASFASLTTALPAELASGGAADDDETAEAEAETESEIEAEAETETETETESPPTAARTDATTTADTLGETAREFVRTRRSILLATEFVDRRLARLEQLEGDAVAGARAPLLADFVETARTLQAELRELVSLAELVATALGRCYGCFEPLAGDETAAGEAQSCPTCAHARRDTGDWQRPDSTAVDFERLFSATNDTLRDASATTEELTDRTTALATELVAE